MAQCKCDVVIIGNNMLGAMDGDQWFEGASAPNEHFLGFWIIIP